MQGYKLGGQQGAPAVVRIRGVVVGSGRPSGEADGHRQAEGAAELRLVLGLWSAS